MDKIFDTAILGAGASGLMCAARTPRINKIIIEGNTKPGLKILASGGGLCNFSNMDISVKNYFGCNTMFCVSALNGFKPEDFTALLDVRGITHTKRPDGKLFAKKSSDILNLLLNEIEPSRAKFALGQKIKKVSENNEGVFEITTQKQIFKASSVICALGGLSYPALGASAGAYKIAESFGLKVIQHYPALTGIIFNAEMKNKYSHLAGVSCRARVTACGVSFADEILFTHNGLSGPAVLQISLYGIKGKNAQINFLPDDNISALMRKYKNTPLKPAAVLAKKLPRRLADALADGFERDMSNINKKDLDNLKKITAEFSFKIYDINGYDKAEITAGGVDTAQISSKTMETKNVPGLYFTGEALDVSGQLGGYNLHWAWASANACAKALNKEG